LLPAYKTHPWVLALSGPLQAAFKSVPDRFVAHPSDLLK
jgi:hypothetical protein